MAKEITKTTLQRNPAATVLRSPQAKPDSGRQPSGRVTAEQRQVMICEAAYYIAEHRGFEAGHDVDDWLAAERQIDGTLKSLASRADLRPQR